MSEPLLKAFNSRCIRERQEALRLGAAIEERMFTQIYSIELGWESYRKLLFRESGTCHDSTCPVSLMLGTDDWRVWHIGSQLYLAYDHHAKNVNAWWSKLVRSVHPCGDKLPVMYGDLVLFRFGKAIQWDELAARRELINYLVTHYRKGASYNFCWEN